MPVSPDGGARFAKALADLYGDAAAHLIALVARRLAAGITERGWAEQKLSDVLRLRRDAQRFVTTLADQADATLYDLLADAYASGVLAAGGPGVTDAAPGIVAANRGAVQAYAAQLAGTVQTTHTRILRTAEDIYQRVIADATGQVVTGVQTRREVAARAVSRLAGAGVTGYTDSRGRNWELASYVEMATRTTAGQAHVQGGLDRYAQTGRELVIVSDAPEECEKCRPFEGRVLSLTGREPTDAELGGHRYGGTLAQARSDGFMHPNAILGDQRCASLGQVENAVRARYVGPSVHLATARGNRLTVSPNHPVLTARGWLRADVVREGDEVFSRQAVERVRHAADPVHHLDHPPATFQQVLDALGATGTHTRVAAAADDFHGDGRFYEGEVHVVWAEGALLDVVQPGSIEQAGELSLFRPGVQQEALAGAGALLACGHGVRRPVAGALADGHAASLEAASDGRVADAVDPREALAGLACGVAADKVVHVERGWFVGHAYDLQTTTGAYLTDGIIVHNCRHALAGFTPGLTRPPKANTADPAGDAIRQEQRGLERSVRESKRRVLAAKQFGDTGELRHQEGLLRTRQGALSAFISEHDRKAYVSDLRTNLRSR